MQEGKKTRYYRKCCHFICVSDAVSHFETEVEYILVEPIGLELSKDSSGCSRLSLCCVGNAMYKRVTKIAVVFMELGFCSNGLCMNYLLVAQFYAVVS